MKINKKKFKALIQFVTDIRDDIDMDAYDEILYGKGYADAWELIEDIISKILDIPEESIQEIKER